MSETKDIVIVGMATGGMNAAHYLLKRTLPSLKTSQPSENYRLVLVDQSSQYYWRIGAPRAMVSTALLPHSKTFYPMMDGFKQYSSDAFVFHQGTATSIDTTNRTLTFKTPSGTNETIPYAALIIATGTSTPTTITSLQGDYKASQEALDAMNKRLSGAKEIVITGGGPVGVETAGEIGEYFNGTAGMFKSQPEKKVKVTLIAGSSKLLPVLRKGLSDKAEKFLTRVGVDVIYDSRVSKVELSEADAAAITIPEVGIEATKTTESQTKIHLDNGKVLTADVYLPASGAVPNSSWIPKQFLDDKGFVNTDTHMRVSGAANDRIYATGDISNIIKGALNVYASIPVLCNNVALDLAKATGSSTNLQEKEYKIDNSETQLVPVGRSKGVGAMKGFSLPSLMVWGIKGRDYMTSFIPKSTHGTQW